MRAVAFVLVIPTLLGWVVALCLPVVPLASRPLRSRPGSGDLAIAVALGCVPALEVVLMLWVMFGTGLPLNRMGPFMDPGLHLLVLVAALGAALLHGSRVSRRSGEAPKGWLLAFAWGSGALILSRSLLIIMFFGV